MRKLILTSAILIFAGAVGFSNSAHAGGYIFPIYQDGQYVAPFDAQSGLPLDYTVVNNWMQLTNGGSTTYPPEYQTFLGESHTGISTGCVSTYGTCTPMGTGAEAQILSGYNFLYIHMPTAPTS